MQDLERVKKRLEALGFGHGLFQQRQEVMDVLVNAELQGPGQLSEA